MSGFNPDWLALREPYDRAARNSALAAAVRDWAGERVVRIADLGTGTGSNVRALAPQLAPGQHWRLFDHDPVLLARAATLLADCSGTMQREQADLRDLAALNLRDCDLISAAALLDLVSADWCEALAALERPAYYIVLSYDGRIDWQPTYPFDADLRDLVNRHQCTDKGFGPALGPAAVPHLAQALRGRGYRVVTGASPWSLGPAERAMQTALLEGWVQAAAELAPVAALTDWASRRRAHIAAGQSRLTVGHLDLFAYRP